MEQHHTPGPWTVGDLFMDSYFIKAQGRTLVMVNAKDRHYETRENEHITRYVPIPNAEADARLIAAAPDLLAAVKKAMHDLSRAHLGEGYQLNLPAIVGDLSAAAAKAEVANWRPAGDAASAVVGSLLDRKRAE